MAKAGSSQGGSSSKPPKIFWDKSYSYRTDRFIEWCNDNPTQRIKLFSDSTQDARKERRTKSQLASAKRGIFEVLACYVFENDPELAAEWKERPQIFVSATQRRHST